MIGILKRTSTIIIVWQIAQQKHNTIKMHVLKNVPKMLTFYSIDHVMQIVQQQMSIDCRQEIISLVSMSVLQILLSTILLYVFGLVLLIKTMRTMGRVIKSALNLMTLCTKMVPIFDA